MMHFIKMSICYYFEILIPVSCSMNQLNKNMDIMPFDSVSSSSLQKIAKVILNLSKSSWREQMMPTIFSVWVQLQVLHLQVRFKLLLFNVPMQLWKYYRSQYFTYLFPYDISTSQKCYYLSILVQMYIISTSGYDFIHCHNFCHLDHPFISGIIKQDTAEWNSRLAITINAS